MIYEFFTEIAMVSLSQKLAKRALVGSLALALSSPIFAVEFKKEITDAEILDLVEKTKSKYIPALDAGWDNNGKKGVYMAWDFDKDGNFDLLAGYEFIPGTIREIGEYFTGIPKPLPSEILLNGKDPEHYDTTKGDIFLKRVDGEYVRERLVESDKSI